MTKYRLPKKELDLLLSNIKKIILTSLASIVNDEPLIVNRAIAKKEHSKVYDQTLILWTEWYTKTNEQCGGCPVSILAEAQSRHNAATTYALIRTINTPHDARFMPMAYFTDIEMKEIYKNMPYIPRNKK